MYCDKGRQRGRRISPKELGWLKRAMRCRPEIVVLCSHHTDYKPGEWKPPISTKFSIDEITIADRFRRIVWCKSNLLSWTLEKLSSSRRIANQASTNIMPTAGRLCPPTIRSQDGEEPWR